jgi:hypothetical protein
MTPQGWKAPDRERDFRATGGICGDCGVALAPGEARYCKTCDVTVGLGCFTAFHSHHQPVSSPEQPKVHIPGRITHLLTVSVPYFADQPEKQPRRVIEL